MAEELDAETLAFAHQMFELAREGEAEKLSEYLDNGLPANLTNDKGDTLLILAAYHDKAEAVQVLLAHGADVERINDRGQTALAAAVFRKSAKIVQTLLDAGADINAGSPSAVGVAQFFELPEMTELLHSTKSESRSEPENENTDK